MIVLSRSASLLGVVALVTVSLESVAATPSLV